MDDHICTTGSAGNSAGPARPRSQCQSLEYKSQDLLRHVREVEIEHEGEIYRLLFTQLNKLDPDHVDGPAMISSTEYANSASLRSGQVKRKQAKPTGQRRLFRPKNGIRQTCGLNQPAIFP
jgi:hypothetical protein